MLSAAALRGSFRSLGPVRARHTPTKLAAQRNRRAMAAARLVCAAYLSRGARTSCRPMSFQLQLANGISRGPRKRPTAWARVRRLVRRNKSAEFRPNRDCGPTLGTRFRVGRRARKHTSCSRKLSSFRWFVVVVVGGASLRFEICLRQRVEILRVEMRRANKATRAD